MDTSPLTSIDLNLLVVLDELLVTRSVTRTAGRLGLSQPAVSNALARLRRRLGDALLVRTPSGMAPTPRALSLQTPLREALRSLTRELFEQEDFRPATSTRRFSIAATDYVQFIVLPPACPRGAAARTGHHAARRSGRQWLSLDGAGDRRARRRDRARPANAQGAAQAHALRRPHRLHGPTRTSESHRWLRALLHECAAL